MEEALTVLPSGEPLPTLTTRTSLFSWVERPHCTFPRGASQPLGLVYHPIERTRGLPPGPPMCGQSNCPGTVAGPGAHGATGVYHQERGRRPKGPECPG